MGALPVGFGLQGANSGVWRFGLGRTFSGVSGASQPLGCMRVEACEYHTVAAASPEVSTKVGALARERIGGLQGIAAEPPKPRVSIIGHRWDTTCSDLRRFLARNQISFEWCTPDSPTLPTTWAGTVDSDLPVLRLA